MEIQKRIDNGIEYRKLSSFEVRLKADDSEDNSYIVAGYATTFDQPYELCRDSYTAYIEQIDKDAFSECDMSDVIMQYDHEGRVYARTRNETLSLSVDEKGLYISADLGGTEGGRMLYEEIKGGYIDRMSFGFVVAECKREVSEDIENDFTSILRTITRISKLYDVSAVSIPANDATSISARSVCDKLSKEIEHEKEQAEQIKRKRSLLKLLLEV